jgi:cysteine synthase B
VNSDVLNAIGNTPLLELKQISRDVAPVRIFGKAEFLNPGGSVKDRPALNMVRDGEKTGRLTKDKTLLDATSGNTGVAYAMIGAALGYRVKLCVPKNIGTLRQRILEAYGAEIVTTNPQMGSDGAILEAIRLNEETPGQYFYADQYNNPANWRAHYEGTAEEVIRQTKGEFTHFVAGLGTSGTFMGTGKRLREFNAKIQLISVEPDSPFHGLEGMKHMATSIVPGIYDSKLADRALEISTEEAQKMTLRLAREEGLLVGMSSGAAVAASLQVARELKSGTIVTILCDGGSKYLDMNFWRK